MATGFHRNGLKNREAGVKQEEARFEEVVDRTNTVGTVWLGLTVGCAQCHDHKYDPISQREYYELFSFMNSTEDATIDAPLPGRTGTLSSGTARFLPETKCAASRNIASLRCSRIGKRVCARPWITQGRTWTGTFRSPPCAPCWMEQKSCCAKS